MIASRIGPERLPSYQAAIFITAVATALAAAAWYIHSPRAPLELKAEDAIVRLAPQAPHRDVMIVALDDAGVTQYGAIKTWPRSLLAKGLQKIEDGDPKTVVMDLALDKRTKTGDAALWRVIANYRNVVLGMSYDADRPQVYTPDDIRGLVFLEKYALAGHLTYDPARTASFPYMFFEPPVSDFAGSSRGIGVFDRETDQDGVLRTARLVYRSTVQYPATAAPLPGKFPESHLADGSPVALPNIALVTAQRVFDVDKDSATLETGNIMRIGGNINPPVRVPIDDQGRMQVRYAGPAGTIPRVSFGDVVSGKVDPATFKNKVVIFGATAANDDATDAKLTPYPGLMPRVEVTANAVTTVMNRSYFGRYETRVFGMLILIGVLVGLALMFTSGVKTVGISALLLVAYVAAGYGFLVLAHIMLPILAGVAVILITLLVSLALYAGPFRPLELEASPTYVPPKETVSR